MNKTVKFITFLSLFSFATVSLPVAPQKQSIIQRAYKHRYFKRAFMVSFGITIIFLAWYNQYELPFLSENKLDSLLNNAFQTATGNLDTAVQSIQREPNLNAEEREFAQEMTGGLIEQPGSNYQELLSLPLGGWAHDVQAQLGQLASNQQ